ncbi:unnamed protein product [Caenorhabditis angaria]|uniref:Major facilitator superfamily (MFS) profile domain-containing protein n=1 Tax=Caenorhabditis angaria TaxID=860376 RepID=A0A9P1IWP6_9PELO|nr:unnamed protein product [Caenorhabditis angaria]
MLTSRVKSIDEESICSSSPNKKSTNWTSLWFANLIQFFCGLQMSLYFTSMWPYLLQLDPKTPLTFFGTILASFSVGQAIGSPIFGTWSEKSESFKIPIATGLALCVLGNLIYAALPEIHWNPIIIMLIARIIIGFGCGNLSALRAYIAACSLPEDRNKAVALSIGSTVFGMLFGPALQACFAFIPAGNRFLGLVLDCYTLPAIMISTFLSVMTILIFFHFTEDFVGIIDPNEDGFELPPYDRLAAWICIYLWFLIQTIAVNIESLAAVFTIAMYNWTSEQAMIYNGYIEFFSCGLSVTQYLIFGLTRVGKINKRYMILFGLLLFTIYHTVVLPWPFYPKTLTYNPNVTDGACTFKWCQYVPQIPIYVFIPVYVLCVGIAFPYIGTSIGTLFTHILGDRQQGTMQGIYALFGSVARCAAPIITTTLFNSSGYTWISVELLVMLFLGAGLVGVFWERLVALKPIKKSGSKY